VGAHAGSGGGDLVKLMPIPYEIWGIMNDARMEIGRRFWSLVWFSIAEKVVATAGEVYELSPEQQNALKRVFLRPGDYIIKERSK